MIVPKGNYNKCSYPEFKGDKVTSVLGLSLEVL